MSGGRLKGKNMYLMSLRTAIDEPRQSLINAGLSSLKEKVEGIPKEKSQGRADQRGAV